jgi:hypothetical protein
VGGEEKKKVEGGVVRDTTILEGCNLAVWKVPRQCPLGLLVKARLVLEISSILILKMLERL